MYKRQMIYIADYDNSRVIGVYADGTVFQIFERPSAEFYDAEDVYKRQRYE